MSNYLVFDTAGAPFVWEWRNDTQCYIPLADVRLDWLVPENSAQHSSRGTVDLHEDERVFVPPRNPHMGVDMPAPAPMVASTTHSR